MERPEYLEKLDKSLQIQIERIEKENNDPLDGSFQRKLDMENIIMLQSADRSIGETNNMLASICLLMDEQNIALDEIDAVLKAVRELYSAHKNGVANIFYLISEKKAKEAKTESLKKHFWRK